MSLRRVDTHVFSRPAVASSFDFSKSNFEVLELTARPLELTGIACHIESSGRHSARSAHCDDLTMSFGIRHVFSRPAVASSFDFSKSNFEVLELTRTVCHIESSGRRSARSAHCDDLTMSFGIRHVFSKPAVASSFDFSKSNFEVLELTRTVCHIERSRDAKPDVIATWK